MSSFNDRPQLTTNTEISVIEGGEFVISSTTLQTIDDTDPAQLLYRITAIPGEGALKLNGNTLSIGSTFTQADLNNGDLSYLHNGSDTVSDRFSFTVSDSGLKVPDQL